MTMAETVLRAEPTWAPGGADGGRGVAPRAFHRTFPGYAVTPLREAPACAAGLGVARVVVKDESARMGLPAFKILGASWAVRKAVLTRAGLEPDAAMSLEELRGVCAGLGGLRLCTATDGNHGRAVARTAGLLGLRATIFMPAGAAQARVDRIASEGAHVHELDGGYDDAVARAAREAQDGETLVISDTSWPGYTDVPRWVIEGYTTLFDEIAEQGADADQPTVVALPVGVGALAAAGVRHYAGTGTRLVSVEPTRAACVLQSVEAGELRTVDAPEHSVMAGLQCETPSLVAWDELAHGFDAYVAIDDTRVPEALHLLQADGIVAGETGASALAGLLLLRDRGELRPDDRALVLCTEGATDPEGRARLLASAGV
ncbi:MAG TPA: diaminopropionate ammonia-lyase [Solirubrobacteraceae bacterium]|nr:diaminopropionate ammonia-lyase [Solirubrobacteraceae bacterium]